MFSSIFNGNLSTGNFFNGKKRDDLITTLILTNIYDLISPPIGVDRDREYGSSLATLVTSFSLPPYAAVFFLFFASSI